MREAVEMTRLHAKQMQKMRKTQLWDDSWILAWQLGWQPERVRQGGRGAGLGLVTAEARPRQAELEAPGGGGGGGMLSHLLGKDPAGSCTSPNVGISTLEEKSYLRQMF